MRQEKGYACDRKKAMLMFVICEEALMFVTYKEALMFVICEEALMFVTYKEALMFVICEEALMFVTYEEAIQARTFSINTNVYIVI